MLTTKTKALSAATLAGGLTLGLGVATAGAASAMQPLNARPSVGALCQQAVRGSTTSTPPSTIEGKPGLRCGQAFGTAAPRSMARFASPSADDESTGAGADTSEQKSYDVPEPGTAESDDESTSTDSHDSGSPESWGTEDQRSDESSADDSTGDSSTADSTDDSSTEDSTGDTASGDSENEYDQGSADGGDTYAQHSDDGDQADQADQADSHD